MGITFIGYTIYMKGEDLRRLEHERKQFRIDLLQPGHPEFEKHWGTKVVKQKLARERQESISRDMKGALQERKEWEARQKASEGTEWKSKRL